MVIAGKRKDTEAGGDVSSPSEESEAGSHVANTSGGLSFKSYLRRLPKTLVLGFLQAIGIRRIKPKRGRGMYWARDSLGRWELRVPALSLDEQPPV
jgi:hypothetical protein